MSRWEKAPGPAPGSEPAPIHAPLALAQILEEEGRAGTALCLSGGGARSAIFSLGVIQALARQGWLEKCDYLSTVGGGGWTGAWLSAWIARSPSGIEGVAKELSSGRAEPIERLRGMIRYLNPFATDSWVWATQWLRNTIVHWALLMPLALIGLLLPHLCVQVLRLTLRPAIARATLAAGILLAGVAARHLWRERRRSAFWWFLLPLVLGAECVAAYLFWTFRGEWRRPLAVYAGFAPPALLAALLFVAGLFAVITSFTRSDTQRQSRERLGALLFSAVLLWGLLSFAALLSPEMFFGLPLKGRIWILTGGAASVLITVLAGYSSATAAGVRQILESLAGIPFLKVVPGLLATAVLLVAPPAAILCILFLLALGAQSMAAHAPQALWPLAAILLARFVNINRFSMTALYRDRLIAVWLGASNLRRDPFTGFDPMDNLPLSTLADRPLHIFNMSAYLFAGQRLARRRQAVPFSASRLHCGSAAMGYRHTKHYARGLSLGTAMAVSGCASSANVGYHHSGLVRLILTLFNARLGWWSPNPGPAGYHVWMRTAPGNATAALLADAAGAVSDLSSFLHLSDGGHCDNLGLYEMVLRRCRYILVVDASQDPNYTHEELGKSLTRVQVDLGIPIEFPEGLGKEKHCSAGRVVYSAVDGDAPDGVLLYLKPKVTGDEPGQVTAYAAGAAAFPHQILEGHEIDEAQFEAYRALGEHSVHAAADLAAALTRV